MANHARHQAAKNNAIAANEAREADSLTVAILANDWQQDRGREPCRPCSGGEIESAGLWSVMLRTATPLNGGWKNFANDFERVEIKIVRLTASFVIAEDGAKYGRSRLTECVRLW